MSAHPNNSDGHSLTSSDLGSSHGNDVINTPPCDVRDKVTSVETASADDSLTLDSLEEEEGEEEEGLRNKQIEEEEEEEEGLRKEPILEEEGEGLRNKQIVKSPTDLQSVNLTDSLNGAQKLNNTNTNSKMNNNDPHLSNSNGVSELTSDASTATCSKFQTENGEYDALTAGETEPTPNFTETNETTSTLSTTSDNSEPSLSKRLFQGMTSPENNHSHEMEPCSDGILVDKSHDPVTTLPPSSSSPCDDSENSSSIQTGTEGHHAARRPRSLTGSESTSSSSRKSFRRSGIPRRKLSDQSSGSNGFLSTKNTPLHSPSSVYSGVTLNSAELTKSLTPSANNTSPSPSFTSPKSMDSSPLSPCGGASFMQTPTPSQRALVKGQRSGSACETMSVLSASSTRLACYSMSRDTVTSRMRIEKHHQDHEHEHVCSSSGESCKTYLTPYQRKDLTIKDLKTQVYHLSRQLESQEQHVMDLRETALKEKEEIETQLRREVEEARGLAETARKEVTSLQESHEESVKMVATLQQQLEDVKNEMARRLAQAEDIFLEMYKKGRESAVFEREEELELQGKGGRDVDATEAELRNKLVRTQAELAKWQTIQRHDSYHASPLPVTEAETTLRFLKDSVFHFLTSDKKRGDEHLRAMVKILKFSEVQKDKIAQAIVTKRNKALF